MVLTNALSNVQNNKCPHGLPSGACPICNGSMAASRPKDRNKPRVAGEMSYNECLAEWNRMQKAKQAKIQDKIDKKEALAEANLKKRIEQKLEQIQNKIKNYFNKLDNAIKKLPPVIQKTIAPAIKFIQGVLNVVVNFVFNISNFIASVSEKMAMVLYETKNHILQFVQRTIDKTKKIIKVILSLFMEFEEDNDNSDKKKIEEIIKHAINKITRKEKQKENELI